MKKIVLPFFGIIMLFSIASCTVEIREDNDIPVTDNPISSSGNTLNGSGTLSGTYTNDVVVKKGTYDLVGIVKIADGATITIEPGAIFKASTSQVSGLVILKGGKIKAEGTSAEPVVFTTNNKQPGDWCGITIYGNAPIKAVGGAATAISEDGLSQIYGGTDPNSNSGFMKFVRVEYAGRKIGDGTSEFNTFTFYAVGAGTILENLVAYKGTDDGYEWFGGSVSGSNLVSYGNYDDSFDWQDGWYGQANQNFFAYQTGIGNFGMEIEASSNADNTAPKINNITLIRATGTNPESAGSIEISAIQFKKHGTGIFTNVYTDGYKNMGGKNAYAILIQDLPTETSQLLVTPAKINVSPIHVQNSDNIGNFGYSFTTTQPKTYTNTAAVSKVSLTAGAWATVDGVNLLSAL